MPSPPTPWTPLLTRTGQRCLAGLAPRVERADPGGTISPRSRLLCAALSRLALEVHAALGGADDTREDVALAAAELALLTKLDDQVIDGRAFHGGQDTDRAELAARTREYLAPTLQSIRDAHPASPEPRSELAADLGARLAALTADAGRLEPLLELIARGWAIQVDAVTVLSAHPSRIRLGRVARTSSDISGAWLLMIAMVGTLPPAVQRGLTTDEQRAFFDYGLHIQLADALADLHKDLDDGLISTHPGRLCWERSGEELERCSWDPREVYRLVAATGADLDSLPAPATLDALDRRLGALGRLADLMRWIHGFLTWRYVVHPLSHRSPADAGVAPLLARDPAWAGYLEHGASDPDRRAETSPCSGP